MLWQLFISFLKIGAFTFGGGYAMVPLIEREVIDKKGWVKREDFLDLLTIAQSAPGPIALNTAVFVGYRISGLKGALSALMGIVLPSFTMILLANIVAGLPSMVSSFWANLVSGKISGIVIAIVSLIIGLGMVVFVVFMNESERRLPIQYAKKVVGRKMYGGQSSTLPLKLTMTGVMPIIFANSIVTIPATIKMFLNVPEKGFWASFFGLFEATSWVYLVLTFLLIIAFAYFYTAISFNPIEISNNLKKNGGFIPGIRPGKPTADYITKILNRITLIGAIFLGAIAVVPMIANIIAGGNLGALAFSGNSIIIVVGVLLETTREIESQLSTHHYKGFLE